MAAALRAQYEAILRHDPGTRLGRDPEELHQMRVATRRMRAILRAARPLLDGEWVRELRAELGWLGGALGPVRDLDVLVEHLRADAGALGGGDERAFLVLVRRLEDERAADREALVAALGAPRYIALIERLDADTKAPPPGRRGRSLRDLAAREFRRLRKAVRALGPDPPDDELHAARIAVKRARYAAELAERSVGEAATAVIRAAKVLQDVLGDHQDAAVAEARIRALVRPRTSAAQAIAAGRVIERQHERRRVARAEYPAAWRDLERAADGDLSDGVSRIRVMSWAVASQAAQGRRERSYWSVWARPRTMRCDGSRPQPHNASTYQRPACVQARDESGHHVRLLVFRHGSPTPPPTARTRRACSPRRASSALARPPAGWPSSAIRLT